MALVNMNKILGKAKKERYAVPNFDAFNTELLLGVLDAAQEANAPVIIAYAKVFEPITPMEEFAEMVKTAAAKANVPVVLHLDHAGDYAYIKKAVDCGFTSVMIDASDKPFEENIRLTKEVVALCSPKNISVEAELGHVGGLEGYSDGYDDDVCYTEVAEAVEFVNRTGIDALAVSIGTVHGVYKSEPKLNLSRLRELSEALALPLVMHGGSGLTDDDFRSAILGGISKTNIFTDLTIAANDKISAMKEGYMQKCAAARAAVKDEALKKINLFGCEGKAD